MNTTEALRIRRPLPAPIERALAQRDISEEQVLVATDTDLDIRGEYTESWIVATRELVLVFLLDRDADEVLLLKDIRLQQIETARTDTRVGSGFLEIKTNGVFEELARFTNKNAEKFAKVAARLRTLAEGREVQIGVDEEIPVGRCKQCGTRLPDRNMTICPKCLKRGQVFLRFLAMTKQYWPYTTAAMVLVIFSTLIQLVPAKLTQVLVDHVFLKITPLPPWFAAITGIFDLTSPIQWLWALVGLLAVTTALGSIVGWMRETLAVKISNRLGYDLRQQVFDKMQDLAVRYHDTHPVGQLMTRCTQDVETLQTFINQLTSGFGYQLILVVSIAVVLLTMSWQLTLWAIAPAPFVMVFTYLYYKHITPMWRRYWAARSSMANMLNGALTGIRVVKAFAQEKREGRRFDKYSGGFNQSALDVGYATARFYPFVSFLFTLGSYFIWIRGGSEILSGEGGSDSGLTIGVLIAFLSYLSLFYAPLNSLTQMSTWFTSFTTQAHRVFEVLDERPEIEETGEAVEFEFEGAITFENVMFGYDPHIPILQDVSFRVHPGEMVGIVGHSGSGKSTTVNLIMRYYDINEGTIRIDNIDLQNIQKICLRRQVGLVAQDPFLFRGTIAENIHYGNPDVAPEQVLNAALSANAHMFITRNHDGYDSRLGERGSGLSGGERQRVAIARALLHNPQILILDEATSSVDTLAEREIQKAIEALSRGRTVIAIAHRLSTLRNCDRIIVFEEGQIRENGSHEELLALGGIYHKLVEIQSQLDSDRDGSVDNLAATVELEKAQSTLLTPSTGRRRDVDSVAPRIQYLDPKDLRVFSMSEGGMHVRYGSKTHEHVRAYRCFPVTRPNEFIALWIGDSALEHKEIGMIRRLHEVSPSSRMAIEHELAKRYFIHFVKHIAEIEEEVGYLIWHVVTDKGDVEFMTRRFERDVVYEAGPNSRIILDMDNNRYEIQDLDALDQTSKALYDKHVYW